MVVFVGASIFMGGQTSTILSTVGSAIPDGVETGSSGGTDTPVDEPGPLADEAGFATVMDVTRVDLLIIRTGTLELRVDDAASAVDLAARRIDALGGYVSASTQEGDGQRRTASVTYRIPVASWDAAVEGLKTLATDVVHAETQTEDVSATAVDLDARITNLRASETALQAILAGAGEVKDVLAVQSELTSVRGDIEEATARRQHLADQAAYSTLQVRFVPPVIAATVATQRGFDPQAEVDRSQAQLVRIGQKVLSFGIWFAIVGLPVLFALAACVAITAAIVIGTRRLIGARRQDELVG